MFFFNNNIPKPNLFKVVYEYHHDIFTHQTYQYTLKLPNKEIQHFTYYVPVKQKINARSYDGLNIPHDISENWNIVGKNLVLTIDDSYNFEQTKRMFELIKEYNLTATFFPNTIFLNEEKPEHIQLWQDIYKAGFEIGYHTTDHIRKRSVEQLNNDFAHFTEKMRRILNDKFFSMKVVRAPYGYFDNVWMQWVKENNLFNVRWSMTENEDSNYLRKLYSENRGVVLLLHNKTSDVELLQNNIEEYINIAKENGGKIASIYDSIVR